MTAAIFPNTSNAIDAQNHQDFLDEAITVLGALQIKGLATPGSNPGTNDGPVGYFAKEAGTYANFGGVVVATGELYFLAYDGISSWTPYLLATGLNSSSNDPDEQTITSLTSITIPAGKLLEKIAFISATTQNVSAEVNAGQNDLLNGESITGGQTLVMNIDVYADSDITLTINPAASLTVKIYTR